MRKLLILIALILIVYNCKTGKQLRLLKSDNSYVPTKIIKLPEIYRNDSSVNFKNTYMLVIKHDKKELDSTYWIRIWDYDKIVYSNRFQKTILLKVNSQFFSESHCFSFEIIDRLNYNQYTWLIDYDYRFSKRQCYFVLLSNPNLIQQYKMKQ